jgi:DNA repair protein RadC
MEKVVDREARAGTASAKASPREFVTICAECKRIINLHNLPSGSLAGLSGDETLVSHGICEACARRLYGRIFNRGG